MANQYRLTPVNTSDGPQKFRQPQRRNQSMENNQEQGYIQDNFSPGPYSPRDQYQSYSQIRNPQPNGVQAPYGATSTPESRKSPGRGLLWGFIGLVVVLLIIGDVVWMSGVSSSLTHLNQTTTQNSHALSRQNAQLTGIRAQLHQINQQLANISQQLSTFFGNLMQAISRGRF